MDMLEVLIVEDEPLIAGLLTDIMEEMGHHVCAVESTETGAVAAALKWQPQLMIVDAGLARGSGIAAVETILRTGFVPTIMGFDPVWQVVHEDDAATALHLALTTRARGVFNVVGETAAPFSTVVRLSGARSLPLPGPVLRATVRALDAAGVSATPVAMLDFLKYSWVADGERARAELGFAPRVPFFEAMQSMREARS